MHIFPPNQPLPSQQEPLQKRRSSMKVSRPVASYFTYTLGKTKDLYVPLTSRCSSKTLVETRGPNFMLPSSVVASLCRVRDVEHDTQQWKHWCFYLDSQDGPQKVPPSLPPVAELPPLTSPRENDRQQQHEQQQQPPKRLPCIHDLRMEIEDYIRINDTVDYSVIFSGEGEPTLRLDDLIALVESLQGKKVMRSVEFCAGLASGGGGGSDKDAEKIKALEQENAALKAEVASLKAKLNPPKANPAPAQAPPPQQYNHGPAHPVARHAAGGAAKGAVLGAVAGAIAGDPAQGAKMGAAVGATAGGMQGLGERRRARLARRF